MIDSRHPGILPIDEDQLTHESWKVFQIMTEFVDGFDLRRVLRFCHEKRKRIPLDKC